MLVVPKQSILRKLESGWTNRLSGNAGGHTNVGHEFCHESVLWKSVVFCGTWQCTLYALAFAKTLINQVLIKKKQENH